MRNLNFKLLQLQQFSRKVFNAQTTVGTLGSHFQGQVAKISDDLQNNEALPKTIAMSVELLSKNRNPNMARNGHVSTIGCRPEVISRRNLETVEKCEQNNTHFVPVAAVANVDATGHVQWFYGPYKFLYFYI